MIAGLILSSFPPERINKSPHHNINTIENIPAARTKRDIASNIKSQKAIDSHRIDVFWVVAYVVSTITIY